MDSLQEYHTHPSEMRGASRKKQNSLMDKEINNFERVICHALGRFKLDMWYEMLTQLIPKSEEITSISALQELVQNKKEKLRESGEDARNDLVVMYFRDFFRDISQLRRMKDIFHTRIYAVLFEYYYDVDAIQEISDVAKTAEVNNNGDVSKSMSKLKEQNLSQIQQQQEGQSSRFPEEVVSELAGDCIEISGIIGELKRLVFSWGRLLNDPSIDTQLFTLANNDEQFKDYDNYEHFEAVFKLIPDLLRKSHQAVVLARNWWFKAEKIQNRLGKIPSSSQSRQVSGRTGTVAGQRSDSQELIDDDYDDADNYQDDEDLQDWANDDDGDKDKYSDDFIDEDDIIEDFGDHGDLSDEDDIFVSSDPGAIVLEKNKTPTNSNIEKNNIAVDQQVNDEKHGSRGNARKQSDKNNRSKQKQDKKPTRKSKPTKARKEFVTEPEPRNEFVSEQDIANADEEADPTAAKDKLQELNANIDAHQRELDIQIQELQALCERNQRVKSLCERLEETISKQIAQRKEAQELMTVKESLEELSEQKTTTPAKQKKIAKHLDAIDGQLEELLQSGKLREYQNELLKEDLELQLAVSPTLVSYGNQVQDQIQVLESQLNEERDKLARLQREFDFMARRGKAGERRHERVRAADGASKSFSADAVNNSRESNISRKRKSEKPARHSDGSAGNLRDSYQSASSGSVFLDDGDIEEFEDEEFEHHEEYVEEPPPEIDSGVGEVWEEYAKPSKDIPLTPAPPTSKNSKHGKQSRGRQTRGSKLVHKTTESKDADHSDRIQPESEAQEPVSPPPTADPKEYQSRRRGTVINKAANKPKGKGKNKKSPRKGKEDLEPKHSEEDIIKDQYKDDEMQTPVQEDFSEINSDIEEGKESGHGLFDPDYLYPDVAAYHDQEKADDTESSGKLVPQASSEPEDLKDAAKKEPSRNKKKSKPVKRGKRTTVKDKEEDLSQQDHALKEDVSQSTERQVPASNVQPKPPTNKVNKTRSRARVAPVKDSMSTSEEEAQTQGDQVSKSTTKRTNRRDASKSRRHESKDKAVKPSEDLAADNGQEEREYHNEDTMKQEDEKGTDAYTKQEERIETNDETTKDKQEKTDAPKQSSTNVRKNSLRGKRTAKKEADSRPAWKR